MRRRALRQHPSAEGLHAVHDAPEIDVDQLLPGVEIFPRLAGIVADAGIVHQERDLAEFFVGLVGERRRGSPASTRRRRQRAPCRRCRQHQRRPLPAASERGAFAVGDHDIHASAGEAFRGRQPDAACASGDDGRAARGEGGDVDRFGVHVRTPHAFGAQSSKIDEYFHLCGTNDARVSSSPRLLSHLAICLEESGSGAQGRASQLISTWRDAPAPRRRFPSTAVPLRPDRGFCAARPNASSGPGSVRIVSQAAHR